MMGSSFRIGRIAGIDIGVNYTWILAFFLIAWSFAGGVFPQLAPSAGTVGYWLAGFIEALLMFICVLLHELAHSLVARSRGLNVSSITLFIFGGVSNLQGEPKKASTEFLMAIVGPATSLLLAVILYLGYVIFPDRGSLAGVTVFYLAYINLSLGLFNLIPGFPLDGGRVFRSIIWAATKNLQLATTIAAGAGQLFGWFFIGIGVYFAFTGNLLNGLWIAFIGWFLNSAADSSRRDVTMREILKGVRVRDVMDPSPACTSPETPISEVVQQTFFRQGYRAAPICVNDRLFGIVTITDVKKIPQEQWATTPVSVITTREPLFTMNEDDDLGEAVRLLSAHDLNQLIVLKNGKLSGLLNRSHVIRYLQIRQELGTAGKGKTTAAAGTGGVSVPPPGDENTVTPPAPVMNPDNNPDAPAPGNTATETKSP
jgi:Zn-dependent protease/CBS domain-containing protein